MYRTNISKLSKKDVLYLKCPGLSRGQIFSGNYEFGGSFGKSLEGDFHEVEVIPNFELLVDCGMSLEGFCHELFRQFYYKHRAVVVERSKRTTFRTRSLSIR